MTYTTLRWLLIPATILHNFEEWATLPLYGHVGTVLQQRFGISLEIPALPVIEVALLLVSLASVALIIAGSVGTPSRTKTWLVCFVTSIYLANVFIPHVPAAFITGGYVPGLGTALFINLPVCSLLLRQATRENMLSQRSLSLTVGLAVVSLPIIITATFWVSSLLITA
ncbi:MAG: HXXEE domain-containing protein [Rhodobiaceae bacterium]|nr:protein of unknown function with HXXEE motif protein [Rhodobiaceae bacterium]MCR9240439.1 HXXEE domain-containing protein [Rhodobiaceae bacterium]